MEFDRLRPYLLQKFEEWLFQQRRIHLIKARALSNEEKLRLNRYFEKRILGLTRIASVNRISNPEFYDELRRREIPIPVDFTSAAGFTLIDCVLLRRDLGSISTLFHEMVHVVQFDLLGVKKLIELYLADLMKKGYQNVLFERQAYDLTAKFTRGESFLVRKILEKELKPGCF